MAVENNINQIQTLFREARSNYPVSGEDYLNSLTNTRYKSVCYEAAAVHEAIKDIKSNDASFNCWGGFNQKHHDLYASQIHVGLGWAMGESNKYSSNFIMGLNPVWAWRVIDGLAYYKGLFERREVIRRAIVPSFITGEFIHAFDEGLGRSLWYTSQGEVERLLRSINIFDSSRHPDLFRGVGIALTYAGGTTKSEFTILLSNINDYKKDFICGVLMGSESLLKQGVNPENHLNFAEKGLLERVNKNDQPSYYSSIQEITSSISV